MAIEVVGDLSTQMIKGRCEGYVKPLLAHNEIYSVVVTGVSSQVPDLWRFKIGGYLESGRLF